MANYANNCIIITVTCCFQRSQYQSWVENLERGKNRSKARGDWHRKTNYKSRNLHVEIRNSNNVEKIEIIFSSIHLQKQFQIMISNITYNPDRNISCQTNLFIPLHGCFQRIHCMHSLWYILCWCPNTKCNITPWTCGKDIILTYKLPCH